MELYRCITAMLGVKNWVLQIGKTCGILNVGKDSCYVCDDALF